MKNFFIYFFSFLFIVFITYITLEFFFLFFPVAQMFDKPNITQDRPTLKYTENQEILYSVGPFFDQKVTKRTNNYGYVNNNPYSKNSSPSFVIIGDSYVEALQVNFNHSIGGLLANKYGSNNVYTLGISGSALSQYEAFLKFAEVEFNPKSYIFVIIENDFDESLCKYKISEGHHCYNNLMQLELIPFHGFSFLRSWARSSPLMRYLVLHLHLDWRMISKKLHLPMNDKFINTLPLQENKQFFKESEEVVDQFLFDVKSITRDKKVYFIVDSNRKDINLTSQLSEHISGSYYFEYMRNYFLKKTEMYGFVAVDMAPIFRNDFLANNQPLNFKTDYHWNERAHNIVADQLIIHNYSK